MDLRRWNDGPDAELEQLAGGDLDMLELSRRLRAARPEPRIDPEFQRRLRAQLMTAAETQLRPRGLGRLLRPRSSLFAYGAAGLGGAMIAAAALAYYAPHSDHVTVVQGVAKINEQHSVNPGNVITISFNHEMDRGSVERGLKIQPAIAYYPPTWHNNELIITPRHSLQPNSPYVVTIPKNAARDVRGDVATKDVVITFGTSPVVPAPTGKPLGPVALVAHEAGAVADGSLLGFSGDGSLLATAGLVAAPASAGGSPAPAPALVRYGGDGPVRLGDAVTAVALSPAGHSLATLTPSGDGVHAVVAVSDTDGTHRSVLSSVADARSPLGWSGDATPAVLFVSGGQLTSVDLEHHQRPVAGVHLDPSQPVRLAPWGRYLFVGPPATTTGTPPQGAPSTPVSPLLPGIPIPEGVVPPAPPAADAVPFATFGPGHVVDLNATTAAPPLQLTGLAAGELPGFSADGRRVAWIDGSSGQPVISVQPLDGSGPAVRVALLPALAGGDSVAAPSLDGTGEHVAYAVRHGDASGELRLAKVSDGSLLATAPAIQPSALTFSPNGAALAYLQRSGSQITAELVSLASVPGAPSSGTAVPAAAGMAIDRLVKAEVAGDRSALGGLVAPAAVADDLIGHLPGALSRGYVISAAPVPGSDSVTAQIRLLRDPTNGHPTAAFADQKVVLRPAGATYLVSQSEITRPFHDEPSGPQVVHVDTSRIPHLTTVHITFDSDLDPSSVTDSVISLGGATSGVALQTVSYDAASRTVTVTVLRLRQPLDLTVGIGVRDVNGQGLAAPFVTTVSPAQ
ncbi:MAG TPA: Ig-like domain-containing protein [Candidatus Dormibacteraeota bacterium]|jgi:hypothetical protein|nr:Ig-like domain-containing protein [Candidatus Dormibacteraeota bacterium]